MLRSERNWLCVPVVAALATSWTVAEAAERVIVVPEESDAILSNPKMGWETFHRPAKEDRNLPDWIPSRVHYARWGWGKLEPDPGRIDYAFLDKELERSRVSGQSYAFRVMCCSTRPGHPYHPGWLRRIGGRVLQTRYGTLGAELEVPDLDDPVVLKAHLDFIRRLGQRYDGHPDLAHIDLGSVGWWGEWHMSGSSQVKMPSKAVQRKIVDAYVAAFRRTPVLMLIDGSEMLSYATSRGTGWRADCLGDMGGFSSRWCHMRNFYLQTINAAKTLEAWRTAPVAWETCWDIRKWVNEGWPLRYIFDYALALHGSVINNKSAPLPDNPEVRAEIKRFLQRLGYRFVLRWIEHEAAVRAGEVLSVQMKWQNIGSAPCYDAYRVAVRLVDPDGAGKVFVGRATVDSWMPGTVQVSVEQFVRKPPQLPPGPLVTVKESFQLPNSLAPGIYRLAVGIVEAQGRQPLVQLGIKGRGPDGWYEVSKVRLLP